MCDMLVSVPRLTNNVYGGACRFGIYQRGRAGGGGEKFEKYGPFDNFKVSCAMLDYDEPTSLCLYLLRSCFASCFRFAASLAMIALRLLAFALALAWLGLGLSLAWLCCLRYHLEIGPIAAIAAGVPSIVVHNQPACTALCTTFALALRAACRPTASGICVAPLPYPLPRSSAEPLDAARRGRWTVVLPGYRYHGFRRAIGG